MSRQVVRHILSFDYCQLESLKATTHNLSTEAPPLLQILSELQPTQNHLTYPQQHLDQKAVHILRVFD